MGATSEERYAVVSCHVERPLDDAVWTQFAALQAARPGGFAIAALMRPADPEYGEDESTWVERAREAAARGPLGHHTHWTSPDHARPSPLVTDRHERSHGSAPMTDGAHVTDRHKVPGPRVRAEGTRLRELGLAPTSFCGGGWYTDVEVAEACAELGYVDCTPRARRPQYLAEGERWASLAAPAVVELPSGSELRVVPTTYSLGDLARTLLLRRRRRMPRRVTPKTSSDLPPFVHVYFHDTDLLDIRRRVLLRTTLPLLARRARVTDLDTLATVAFAAPRVEWADVARL
jgi:hypothetical protein